MILLKIAIAPERKGAAEFIEYAVGEEIIVALAHSDATYEEAKQASEKAHPFLFILSMV